MAINRFKGSCHSCGTRVAARHGELEYINQGEGGHFKLWCMECYNKSDKSGPEDRCCGDRAYEDACERAVNGGFYESER